jgi:hypothetical protein
MREKHVLTLAASMLALFLPNACRRSSAEDTPHRVVRIAEREIDPAQLESWAESTIRRSLLRRWVPEASRSPLSRSNRCSLAANGRAVDCMEPVTDSMAGSAGTGG